MLRENLRYNRSCNGTIGPTVCQAHDEQHCNLHNGSGLVRVRWKGSRETGHDQQRQRLNGEPQQQQTASTELVHGEGIDQDNEQLKNRLDAVDGQRLGARIPTETLINERGIHSQGGNTTALSTEILGF